MEDSKKSHLMKTSVAKPIFVAILLVLLCGIILIDQSARADIAGFVITKDMAGRGIDCKNLGSNPSAGATLAELICEHHRDPRPAQVQVLEDRVEILQRLQTEGLPASLETLVMLLEGLTHCQVARSAMELKDKDVSQRQTFCSARESSFAALRSISWEFAKFTYAADAGRDVDGLIRELTSCQEERTGPLSSVYDSDCGLISALSLDTQSELVDRGFSDVEGKYFGASSPIIKAFAEKNELSKRVLSSVESRITTLKDKADNLGLNFEKSHSFYKGTIENNLSLMTENYKNAYALATAISKRHQEWADGLLTDKDAGGLDLGLQLTGPQNSPSLKDRLSDKAKGFADLAADGKVIDIMLSKLRSLQARQDTYAQSAKKMCAIYFCYLAVGDESDSSYRRACKSSELFTRQKNPLCESTGAKLVADNLSVSPKEFCESVGFDVKRFGKVGLSLESVASCQI